MSRLFHFIIIQSMPAHFSDQLTDGKAQPYLQMQGFTTVLMCNRAIAEVRLYSVLSENYILKLSEDFLHYFELRGTEGMMIA